MRVAVFDLDGTLADTSADLIAAANAALAEAGFGAPLSVEHDRAFAFAGGRAMLRAGMERAAGAWAAEAVEAAYPRLLGFYAGAIDRHTRSYDGVEAALDALAAAGWGLAVCTNKPAALAETLLVRLGLRGRFRAMLGADSLDVRKPDPRHLIETILRAGGAPGRAVLVGDTVTDRLAARAAGVPCVLVSFGPEGADVAALEPEALLDHYAALPALLERLVPA
jgi:phosphoglycolate phosphatase